MIGAGFVMFVTSLSWSTNDVAYTVGQASTSWLPVLFLHVFLAFPDGRLHGRFERVLVGAAYVTAIVLELVRMLLGGFGPHNLLEVTVNPDAAEVGPQVPAPDRERDQPVWRRRSRLSPPAVGSTTASRIGAARRRVRACPRHDRRAPRRR